MQGPRSNDNSGCLVPFGTVFAIIGIGMALSALFQGPVRAPDTGLRLLMSLIFGGAGTAVIIWGVAGRRTAQQSAALALRHPDEPWLWRPDWAEGAADPESKSRFLTYFLMGVLFLLVSAPTLLNSKRELLERHNYAILIALIFPLAGLFLISHALLGRVRTRKFGAIFRTAQMPGIVGGHLRGRIETKFSLRPDQPVDVSLTCIRSHTRAGGKDQWDDILWQDKASVSAVLSPIGSLILVDFEIPFDARETDARNPNDEIFWRLTAARKVPGVDFRVSFQVPVFKTAASDPMLTAAKMEEESLGQLPATQPAGSKIRTGPAPRGGIQFYMGPARSKSVAAATMAIGLFFGAAGFFFGFVIRGPFGWFIGAAPLVIGVGLGALLLIFSLSLWLSTTKLTVANGELQVRSAFLFITRKKAISPAEIQKFELYPGMRSGSQIWYDLKVYLRNGEKVTAGSGLEKHEAEWLEVELRKNLGLSQMK